MAAITVQLPDALFEKAKAAAAAAGLSVEELVAELIINALDDELNDGVDPAFLADLAKQVEDLHNGRLSTRPAAEVLAELRQRRPTN